MPNVRVRREQPRDKIDRHGHISGQVLYDYQNKKLNECTKSEIVGWASKLGLVGAAVIGLASVAIFKDPFGDIPKHIEKDAQIRVATETVALEYANVEDAEEFKLSYIKPNRIQVYSSDPTTGSGFLRSLTRAIDTSVLEINIGQDCLAGSPYDITPVENRNYTSNSSVAEYNYDDNTFVVYSSTTGLPDLTFDKIQSNLVPDVATSKELEKQGCEPGQHAYIAESESNYTKLS